MSPSVLSLLDGPSRCDPAFCVVWFRFHMIRKYLAHRPGEVSRIYRLLGILVMGALLIVLHICLLRVLLKLVLFGLLMWLVG